MARPGPNDLHRVHQLAFARYQIPPEGVPKVLGEWVYTYAQTSRHPYRCAEERILIDVCTCLGLYGIHCCVFTPTPLPKRQPPETLARGRLRRLRQRMERRYPLFAEQMIADELTRKAAYYRGESHGDAARAQLEHEYQQKIERWQAMIGLRAAGDDDD